MSGNWVRTYEHGLDYSESLDGVEWADAPLPPWLHHCQAQTRGYFISYGYIERCRCGAARHDGHGAWINKNETRESRRRQQREARLPRVVVNCHACGQPYEAAEGTRQAAERLCTSCWAEALIRAHGS